MRARKDAVTPRQFIGAGAAVQKYDLLTAMALIGLSGSPAMQTSMLRMVAIVTARYNWAQDEMTMGQREMARIWHVCVRTAKREVKRLTDASILIQLRPGARGRVAAYRLNHAEIRRLSKPAWECVGPDYIARMAGACEPAGQGAGNVIPIRPERSALPEDDGSGWTAAAARLQDEDPVIYRSWFGALRSRGIDGGILTLEAPNGFQASYVTNHYSRRLLAAMLSSGAAIRDVKISAP